MGFQGNNSRRHRYQFTSCSLIVKARRLMFERQITSSEESFDYRDNRAGWLLHS